MYVVKSKNARKQNKTRIRNGSLVVDIPTQQTSEIHSGPQGRCNKCPSGNVHAAYLIATRLSASRLRPSCLSGGNGNETTGRFPRRSSRTNRRRSTVNVRNCENVSSTTICGFLLFFTFLEFSFKSESSSWRKRRPNEWKSCFHQSRRLPFRVCEKNRFTLFRAYTGTETGRSKHLRLRNTCTQPYRNPISSSVVKPVHL